MKLRYDKQEIVTIEHDQPLIIKRDDRYVGVLHIQISSMNELREIYNIL